MAYRVGQANFSKGEISEELVARVDVPQYATALRRARNVVILKYGGVTKRPGTRLVAEVYDDSAPVRLMAFQFSLTQTYALELGQGYMRPAAMGGMVIEERLTIEGVTPGATTIIEAAYHAYEVGDQVYFEGVEGMVELNGRVGRVVSVPDSGHYEIDVDSSGFSAFTGDTGGTTRTAPAPPPPPPPPVPPPPPPPPPPDVGGGGGFGGFCVVDDSLILLPGAVQKEARFLKAGHLVHTQHAETMAWGDYPIEAVEIAWMPVFKADGYPRATGDHPFWINGAWVKMRDIGVPDGKAWVAKITVADAHTYVSAGVLSHNKADVNPDE